MSKQLAFSHNGVDYTLEFTRASVKTMESRGFILSEVSEKPISLLPELFAGAFIAHHRFVKREIIDEIFSKMTGKVELVSKLVEMYQETSASLLEEPEESSGNLNWTASW
mgnify:CR=1 FL=1